MVATTRRLFLASTAAMAVFARPFAYAQDTKAARTLDEALALRKSTRLYGKQPIDPDVLLGLLNAGNGVNRPEMDGRTAPSWHGAKDVDIYTTSEGGTDLFDPMTNALTPVSNMDMRSQVSPEPFVAAAPVVLIYVSRTRRLVAASGVEPSAEELASTYRVAAFVDTAVIAQNVYLFCAANDLGTCLVGGTSPEAIATILGLDADQLVTYVQPVGHFQSA
jgi:hypothetical protein